MAPPVGVPYSPANRPARSKARPFAEWSTVSWRWRKAPAFSLLAPIVRGPQGRIPQGTSRAAEEGVPARQDRRRLLRDRRSPPRLTRNTSTTSTWCRPRRGASRSDGTPGGFARKPRAETRRWPGPSPNSPTARSGQADRRRLRQQIRQREPTSGGLLRRNSPLPSPAVTIPEIEPRALLPSTNPFGACPGPANGLGSQQADRPDHRLVPDEGHNPARRPPIRGLGQVHLALLSPDAGSARPRPKVSRSANRWRDLSDEAPRKPSSNGNRLPAKITFRY